MDKGFFKQFERKTGVEMDEVFALARAIQYADFSNEKQVRKIVQKVSKVAKRKVSPSVHRNFNRMGGTWNRISLLVRQWR